MNSHLNAVDSHSSMGDTFNPDEIFTHAMPTMNCSSKNNIPYRLSFSFFFFSLFFSIFSSFFFFF